MIKFKSKNCIVCGKEYIPTGRCSKYCVDCSKEVTKKAIKKWHTEHGFLNGKGSGSSTKSLNENPSYTDGRTVFRRWARERKNSLGQCEQCNKDLSSATQYEWVGHHIDHNKTNNTIENLLLLCKQCHQIEHKCWKAFEGVTTIPKGSSADNSTKRLTPKG